MDSNSTRLSTIAVDVAGLDGEAMRGVGDAIFDGTVTVGTQTQFTPGGSAGLAEGQIIIFHDGSNYDKPSSARTVTSFGAGILEIDYAPDFTVVTGDKARSYENRGYPPIERQIRAEMDNNSTQLSDIVADTAEIGTAGAGLTDLGGMSTGMKAEVESEVDDAIVVQKLDHLVAVADADDVVDDSVIAKLAAKGATADWSTFVNTDDSLEAISDQSGDVQTDVTAIKAKTDNLPSGMAKNVAVPKYDIYMVLEIDHLTGATGKTVTGTISKDGGSFAALTNTITEVSGGLYTMASGLTQAERNADVSTLVFTADDCDDLVVTIISS
jgi:hypothetical protein